MPHPSLFKKKNVDQSLYLDQHRSLMGSVLFSLTHVPCLLFYFEILCSTHDSDHFIPFLPFPPTCGIAPIGFTSFCVWTFYPGVTWGSTALTPSCIQVFRKPTNQHRGHYTLFLCTPVFHLFVSVLSVTNLSFKQTNLLIERSEQNHSKNWFFPFSVQLSSAASVPARSSLTTC